MYENSYCYTSPTTLNNTNFRNVCLFDESGALYHCHCNLGFPCKVIKYIYIYIYIFKNTDYLYYFSMGFFFLTDLKEYFILNMNPFVSYVCLKFVACLFILLRYILMNRTS